MLPLNSREEARWTAYERVHGPLEPLRGDVATARTVQMIAALVHAWTAEKGDQLPPLSEFLTEWDQPEKSEGELLSLIEGANALFGGEDRRVK